MKFWTEDKKQFLRDNYLIKGNVELGKLLDTTTSRIVDKLRHLNLKRPKGKGRSLSYGILIWTKNKTQFLKNNFLIMHNKDLAKKLDKTITAISAKLHRLGLKRPNFWTEDKIQFLRDNYMLKSNTKLGKILNITSSNIEYKLRNLNLKRPKGKGQSLNHGFWTKKKEQFIQDNYLVKGNIKLGKLLGTTAPSIRKKLISLNLKRPKGKGLSLSNRNKICSEKTRSKIRVARLNQVFPVKDTSIEVAMQNELKFRNISFTTHKPIFGQPDIFIEPNICIFCDGDWFHANTDYIKKNGKPLNMMQIRKKKRDLEVNDFLRKKNFKVLRYWEHEIKANTEGCIDEIEDVIYLGDTPLWH